nr:hypothetical protein [Tanacetum cinerariifolium]
MSDSEHSTVTYTSVPSSVEDYSDIGSPEVTGPLSPNYVPGPEEPEQAPLSPDYFDPNRDLEEDEEEEDPADYPADSTVVALLAIDHVPSEEEVRESLAAGAARQNEPTIARDDPYSLVREELYGFVDRETTIMYGMMEEAQDDRSQLRGQVNLLYRDRSVHRHLAVMVADHRRQRAIKELLAADHKRQVQLTKALRLLKGLQTQMIEFQKHHGPAKGPAQPDAPGEADNSS